MREQRESILHSGLKKLTSRESLTLVMVCWVNWLVNIILPFAFWNEVDKDGYPWIAHCSYGGCILLTIFYEFYVVCKIGWGSLCTKWTVMFKVPMYLISGIVARGDSYTDATFVVIAWCHREESDLWIPASILYVVGVIWIQFFCVGYYLIYRLPGTRDNANVRHAYALYGQMMLIAKSQCSGEWNQIIADFLFAFIRFSIEDVGQAVIQILFVKTVETGNRNSDLILFSILISISFSFLRTYQTLYKVVFYPPTNSPSHY